MDKEYKTTEAHRRGNKKYNEKFSRINIQIPPEKAQEIKENAKLQGLSTTQYIVKCCDYFSNYGDVTKL